VPDCGWVELNNQRARQVKKEGLPYVVEEIEHRVIEFRNHRKYQKDYVKIRDKTGVTKVLRGLDAERARLGKLNQISKASWEKKELLTDVCNLLALLLYNI